MYRDNSNAALWRADALERERRELQTRLRAQEETIKQQGQQILALKNKCVDKPYEAVKNHIGMLSTAEVRALLKTCKTCGAPVEPDEDYQAVMFESWHLHHRSCLEKVNAPKSVLGRGLLLFAILPALFFAFVLLLGMASINPPAGLVAGTMGILALIGIFWFIVWVIAEFG